MQSLAILVFTVVSSFVAIVNWSRIRKPDILLPSIGIALVGGVANVVSTTYVQDFSPTPFMYVYVVGFSLLSQLQVCTWLRKPDCPAFGRNRKPSK